MKNSETKEFIAYEYLSINVKSSKEALYIDCYENFGWKLTNQTALIDSEDYYVNNSNTNDDKLINLKFKRDRRIKNKAELQSLQRKMELALKEIERLERDSLVKGAIKSMSLGVIGTIFLAISVFAIVAESPLYFLSILTGIPGLVGWVLPYWVFLNEKKKVETANAALIEEQYNTLYDNCEKGKKLSN